MTEVRGDAPEGQAAVSARVSDQLRELILSGELLPGERIRQEALAERLNASRVPVREALRVLTGEGLIRLVAHTGAWVASLTQQECVDLYCVRERLEPLLLQQSMRNLTEADLEKIDSLRGQIDEGTGIGSFIARDRAFHWATYAGAPEGFLVRSVEQLWNVTQFYRRRFTEDQSGSGRAMIAADHLLLVDALRRGDEESAVQVLEMHLRRTRLALEQSPEVFIPSGSIR